MPRDANGNYALPSGNPVVSNTVIESTWANSTMADIRQALTDSLDRNGRGGMLVPFKFVDGSHATPAITFTSEVSSGLYRFGSKDIRMAIAGVADDVMKWTDAGVQIWKGGAWSDISGVAANTYTGVQTAPGFKVTSEGLALYWADPTFTNSKVLLGTADPPAGQHGQIYLQYV